MNPRILALSDWYLPGRKAGGVVSALSNLIELLGDDFDFYVFTRDRDLTDNEPYPNVQGDRWVSVGKAKVLYTPKLSLRNVRRRILEIEPDLIHLNSFFSPLTIRVLLLRRLGCVPRVPIVIAPRGEFSPGALQIKPLRKWLYQLVTMRTGLYRDLIWQASSDLERQQITAAGIANGTRNRGCLTVTADAPSPDLLKLPVKLRRPEKRSGAVRLIFLSRISRMKNLHFALESLAAICGDVVFDIVGPVDDAAYWSACQEQIRVLPKNIVVSWSGPVRHEHVSRAFLEHQFLVLPTLGENFGYAIVEALAAGCPVLISDQTPWRDLRSAGAGWDLPLGRHDLWQNALQECVAMDDKIYQLMSQRARCFAEQWLSSPLFHRDSVSLFRSALDSVARQ